MDKEAMNQLILEALSKKLGDGFHFSIQKVLKTNVQLNGLTIMKDGENISPVIYLEPFYEALNGGVAIDDVTEEIVQSYSCSKSYAVHFDTASFLNYDLSSKKLYVELINRHLNGELLLDVPHRLFLDDFAVIVRYMLEDTKDGTASLLVHNHHLDLWNVDQESLISQALHNTRTMMGIDLQPIGNTKSLNHDLTRENILDCPIWILTNKKKLAGASVALFDDILKDFARKYSNFHVIFSSVHEALLLPESYGSNIDFLTRMNQEVNIQQLQLNEILGTKAYYYSKENGFVL